MFKLIHDFPFVNKTGYFVRPAQTAARSKLRGVLTDEPTWMAV
jgi:hypothetical protein